MRREEDSKPSGTRADGVTVNEMREAHGLAPIFAPILESLRDFSEALGFAGKPLRSWPDVAALGITLTFVAFVLWLLV